MSTLDQCGRADFLFADTGYLLGVASLVDLTGTLVYYNASASPAMADALALSQDWYCVGDALRGAMGWADSQITQPAGGEQGAPAEAPVSRGA